MDTSALDYGRALRQFFDQQLRIIGLAEDQIKKQDLQDLELSLQRVNEAIRNPDSFGKMRLQMTAQSGSIVAKASTEAHMELGIMPLLLERKQQVLERIRILRPEQQLSDIRQDISAQVDDPKVREDVIEIIDRKFAEERLANEKLDREQAQLVQDQAREREERLKIEIRERRSAIYRSFLERESVASVVGAILLLTLGASLIVAMFIGTATSAVVTNAFLLILGYFFGQATSRSDGKSSADSADN
jgi:uncharacterized membrane protein